MSGKAIKAASIDTMKAAAPVRAAGNAHQPAAAWYDISTPGASHSDSDSSPSLCPHGHRKQSRSQRRHEHPAPHTCIVAPNEQAVPPEFVKRSTQCHHQSFR